MPTLSLQVYLFKNLFFDQMERKKVTAHEATGQSKWLHDPVLGRNPPVEERCIRRPMETGRQNRYVVVNVQLRQQFQSFGVKFERFAAEYHDVLHSDLSLHADCHCADGWILAPRLCLLSGGRVEEAARSSVQRPPGRQVGRTVQHFRRPQNGRAHIIFHIRSTVKL